MLKAYQDFCPRCNSLLTKRHGKFGDFMGCTSYPGCRFTRPLPGNKLFNSFFVHENGSDEYTKFRSDIEITEDHIKEATNNISYAETQVQFWEGIIQENKIKLEEKLLKLEELQTKAGIKPTYTSIKKTNCEIELD